MEVVCGDFEGPGMVGRGSASAGRCGLHALLEPPQPGASPPEASWGLAELLVTVTLYTSCLMTPFTLSVATFSFACVYLLTVLLIYN